MSDSGVSVGREGREARHGLRESGDCVGKRKTRMGWEVFISLMDLVK